VGTCCSGYAWPTRHFGVLSFILSVYALLKRLYDEGRLPLSNYIYHITIVLWADAVHAVEERTVLYLWLLSAVLFLPSGISDKLPIVMLNGHEGALWSVHTCFFVKFAALFEHTFELNGRHGKFRLKIDSGVFTADEKCGQVLWQSGGIMCSCERCKFKQGEFIQDERNLSPRAILQERFDFFRRTVQLVCKALAKAYRLDLFVPYFCFWRCSRTRKLCFPRCTQVWEIFC